MDNLDEARDMYLSLLEQELNRGPFVSIINLVTKILTKSNNFPEEVINAAAGALGKLYIMSGTKCTNYDF